jgi:hypothetical protein
VRDRGFGPNTARLVLDEKRDLIRKTAALTFTPSIPIEHVGGYQPIRRLLRLAALTFTPDARAFGVEEAKGLLLVGLPGCGKDTIARAASPVLGRALLQLDLGAVMGEGGGLLGSAELSAEVAVLDVQPAGKAFNGALTCNPALAGYETQSDPWIPSNPRAACQEGAPVRLECRREAYDPRAAALSHRCAEMAYISANIAARPCFFMARRPFGDTI